MRSWSTLSEVSAMKVRAAGIDARQADMIYDA